MNRMVMLMKQIFCGLHSKYRVDADILGYKSIIHGLYQLH